MSLTQSTAKDWSGPKTRRSLDLLQASGRILMTLDKGVASLLLESQFLALFLIQIGVPKNPKAARIWFSKKR
jgi:hypothetical protein